MNIVKSVLPLFSIFNLDDGRETAVETRPSLPDWQPAGGDLVPHPGQQVKSVTRRVIQDRNVTIFEQHIEYVTAPEPIARAQPEEPYEIVTVRQSHPPTAAQQQMLTDWRAGRAVWLGGTRHPADIIRNGSAVPGTTRVENGRIVLSE